VLETGEGKKARVSVPDPRSIHNNLKNVKEKMKRRRCCYITMDSATTALQNGACTYQCIS
jgi:hypothetical protein